MRKYLFTSESVSAGHPDKLADQISDAILDAYLAQDPDSRVACETLTTAGIVMISGEITSKAVNIDLQQIVRDTIKEIGYDSPDKSFDYRTVGIISSIHAQSPDIAQGVSEGQGLFKEQGAGDQGMMFGYAVNETPEYMPITIMYAHKLLMKLSDLMKSGELPFIYPDSKSQVTFEYIDGKPSKVESVVVSTQHSAEKTWEEIRDVVIEKVIKPVMGDLLDDDVKIYVNPTGKFVIGGPLGDTGLTGRKIIVDTYGGHGSHGGGAFSGKDPTKVDRSAAYAARYIAKNIVAAGLADKCLVQLAYAIGVAEPVSIYINTFGTNKVDEVKIEKIIPEIFPVKPKDIINELQLKRPIYKKTAAYGHFGRELEEFTWEKVDKVADLKNYFGI